MMDGQKPGGDGNGIRGEEGMPKFTLPQIVTIAATLLAAVIGVGGYFLLNEWYSPDLRYEEGAYYRSEGEAITSLKLHNYGAKDAKDINITAQFLKPLVKDASTNDDAYPFTTTAGGKGQESVAGSIKRVAPDQTLWIYFSVENTSGLLVPPPGGFVHTITYEGGTGKKGQPVFFTRLVTASLYLVMITAIIFVGYVYPVRRVNKLRDKAIAEAAEEINQTGKATLKEVQEQVNDFRKDCQDKTRELEEKSDTILQKAEMAAEKALELKEEADQAAKRRDEARRETEEAIKKRDDARKELEDLKKEIIEWQQSKEAVQREPPERKQPGRKRKEENV